MNNKDFKKRLLGSLIAGLMLSPPVLADKKWYKKSVIRLAQVSQIGSRLFVYIGF